LINVHWAIASRKAKGSLCGDGLWKWKSKVLDSATRAVVFQVVTSETFTVVAETMNGETE